MPRLPGGSTETCWPSFFLGSSFRNLSGSWATGAARQKGRWLAQGFEQRHRGIQYASAAAVGGDGAGDRGPEMPGGRDQSGRTGPPEKPASRYLNTGQHRDCRRRRDGRSYATRRVAFDRIPDRIRADGFRGQASGLAAKVSGGGSLESREDSEPYSQGNPPTQALQAADKGSSCALNT